MYNKLNAVACSSFMSCIKFSGWFIWSLEYCRIPSLMSFFFPHVEEMIRGLTRVPWERVDVSFQKSKQRYIAHSTIQVKLYLVDFLQKSYDAFPFRDYIINYFRTPALDEKGIRYTKENVLIQDIIWIWFTYFKLNLLKGNGHSFSLMFLLFSSLFVRFCSQVKIYWLNSDGSDVIFHMIDNFLI